MTAFLVLALAIAAASGEHHAKEVMNHGGIPYTISNPASQHGRPGKYSTNFLENVDGPVEYFDVYGEVRTKYSQVYWTVNAPINLPPELVKRFDGKVMAITGFEADQVTHTGPELGTTTSAEALGGFACYPECGKSDKSVPNYFAYNHHYFSWIRGKDAEMYNSDQNVDAPQPTKTRFWSRPHTHRFPTTQVFQNNPGGEYRKTYHGYPSGYAQLVHSPQQWIVNPMQIDTHNRKYNLTDQIDAEFAFLPKMDHDNRTDFESGLNPLMECPCSTRIVRSNATVHTLVTRGACSLRISAAEECTAAISAFARVSSTITLANASLPSGCLMLPDDRADHSYAAVFNKVQSSEPCDDMTAGLYQWVGPLNGTTLDIGRHSENILLHDATYGCTSDYKTQCSWESVEVALKSCNAWKECEGIFCSARFGPKFLCFARATTSSGASAPSEDQVWKKVQKIALEGTANLANIVNMTIAHDGTHSTITMSGPSHVWFGAGFDATTMSDLPYAIVIEGDSTVSERRLGPQAPGHTLKTTVTVVSSEVVAGIRTVVLARPVVGATSAHFSLPFEPGALKMIAAVGSGPKFAYHKARAGANIMLVPAKSRACVCQPKVLNIMRYMNESSFEFDGYICKDRPRSDMASHGDGTGRNVSNAACSGKTYHGGLTCCQNSWFLTDKEQDGLIPDEVDTYYLKWRYYFQEYRPANVTTSASHQNIENWYFWIDDHIDDYEEDNAVYGKSSIGKISANLTVKDLYIGDATGDSGDNIPLDSPFKIMVASPHCHAPSCLFTELWNADTNELICNGTVSYSSPVHGPSRQVFNERGYIAINPCIFGYQPGLQEPFTLTLGTRLRAVKVFNNTYRHLGQMAQWTGFLVREPAFYV